MQLDRYPSTIFSIQKQRNSSSNRHNFLGLILVEGRRSLSVASWYRCCSRDACLYYLHESMALRSRQLATSHSRDDRSTGRSFIPAFVHTPAHTLIQRCRSSCHASSPSWSCSYSPSRRTPSTVTHDVTRTTHTNRPDQTRPRVRIRSMDAACTHTLTHSCSLLVSSC
jgi:hypothetical protein